MTYTSCIDLTPQHYDKSEYIETDTGNKVSRKSVIHGSQNIILGGKTIIQSGSIVRGDLRRAGVNHTVVIGVGKFALLAQRTVIRPPSKVYKNLFSYYPIKIGDFVHIGEDSVVEAANIGSYVEIGKNCIIVSEHSRFSIECEIQFLSQGRFAIIKDCAKILDNAVIPPNCIIPSFSVYGGNPGTLIDELPECWPQLMEKQAKLFYSQFTPK
ncbi:hypothetical protein HDU83_002050 [Entophlyctis luteolus]|nr:hypothetical protein HDU83_002050 [Entophlyctis luteolus]